jgi:alpha-galactosidase
VFNRGAEEVRVVVKWADLGLTGKLRARDLWAKKDVAVAGAEYSVSVPGHGVVLLRVER